MDTPNRDWVEYLIALLTPTIIVFGILIAFLQWRTNRNRLKHELFDRRYKQFEAVRDYLSSILSNGRVKSEDNFMFLSETCPPTSGNRCSSMPQDSDRHDWMPSTLRLDHRLVACRDLYDGATGPVE